MSRVRINGQARARRLPHAARSLVAVSIAACLLWAAGPHASAGLVLTDVAHDAGLRLLNVSGGRDKDYIIESVGNGAAWLDFDNDGWLDVLIVNGSTRERLAAGGDPLVALYRNEGNGRFTDVTARSGLDRRRGWGMGVCVADYDNDGFQDVYVTALGRNVLWRNNGDGTFSDVTERAGVGDTRWGTGCAFGDYDRDGFVDLYVVNYVDFDDSLIPARATTKDCRFMEIDVFCGPRNLPGAGDVLYRNSGTGTFTDVTTRAGVAGHEYYGFGVIFGDLTGDGWPDIYVANDSVPNLLFVNRGDGTFSEEGLASGTALSGDGRAQAGMGVDAGDADGDGLPDLIVTHFSHDHTTLYRNDASGFFTDASYASGMAATAGPYLGWGVGFVDLDNDGWLDVFVANGHVYPQVDGRGLGTSYQQRNQVFHNLGMGRFRHVTEHSGGGLLIEKSSRGAAFADYDNDGDVDILVIDIDDRPTLLRNDTPGDHHWITFRLVGTTSNRDAIGARVRVRTGDRWQTREIRSGGSYLSHNDMRAHFGLGQAGRVDEVEIRWPGGSVDTLGPLEARRAYVATEGAGVAAR